LNLRYTDSRGYQNDAAGCLDRSKFIVREEIDISPKANFFKSEFGEDLMAYTPSKGELMKGIGYSQAKAYFDWLNYHKRDRVRPSSKKSATANFFIPNPAQWRMAQEGTWPSDEALKMQPPGPYFRYVVLVKPVVGTNN